MNYAVRKIDSAINSTYICILGSEPCLGVASTSGYGQQMYPPPHLPSHLPSAQSRPAFVNLSTAITSQSTKDAQLLQQPTVSKFRSEP
ncbi:jg17301 [Pararge aegeria aegeria]|uniref:Jg17301 protein n=1 Tax=Pararge aegeria aegeria TaxID=348720 RepID=A0A8S4R0U8_9NEOP|nr:jg17301 [Pararge aegeria aegeria]